MCKIENLVLRLLEKNSNKNTFLCFVQASLKKKTTKKFDKTKKSRQQSYKYFCMYVCEGVSGIFCWEMLLILLLLLQLFVNQNTKKKRFQTYQLPMMIINNF
jgi:hypothetical protein